jgi:hypothetical protein
VEDVAILLRPVRPDLAVIQLVKVPFDRFAPEVEAELRPRDTCVLLSTILEAVSVEIGPPLPVPGAALLILDTKRVDSVALNPLMVDAVMVLPVMVEYVMLTVFTAGKTVLRMVR